MRTLKIITILLFWAFLPALGQDSLRVSTADSTQAITKKNEKIYPLLSSVAVLVDYGKLAADLVLRTESKYDFGVQVVFKNKIFLAGEYGRGVIHTKKVHKHIAYESRGNYYRLGVGYKVDMNPKNNFFFSIRYGRAAFSDRAVIVASDAIKNDPKLSPSLPKPFQRPNLMAYWYEAVMSSESRLWKGLYIGFHLRLRVMGRYDRQTPMDVYAIPGYGRTFDRTIPALNLYVKYAIAW